jgi:hypothetical protein
MTQDKENQELRERLIKAKTQIEMLMDQRREPARSFIYDFAVGFVVVLGASLLVAIIIVVFNQIF